MTTILIVDDDQEIRDLLQDYLTRFGMQVITVADGCFMKQALAENHFDLIILDLMLPDEDGISLCKNLRASTDIPIIMLTARGEPTDKIIGLETGADDYVIKPFEPRELVARINAILRRTGKNSNDEAALPEVISFYQWKLNNILRQLTSPDGLVIPLSNAEFRLLKVFIDNPGRALSRDYLLDQARGRNMEMFDRSIDLLVSRLRQKLHDDPRIPLLIKTVRGEGYLFDAQISHALK